MAYSFGAVPKKLIWKFPKQSVRKHSRRSLVPWLVRSLKQLNIVSDYILMRIMCKASKSWQILQVSPGDFRLLDRKISVVSWRDVVLGDTICTLSGSVNLRISLLKKKKKSWVWGRRCLNCIPSLVRNYDETRVFLIAINFWKLWAVWYYLSLSQLIAFPRLLTPSAIIVTAVLWRTLSTIPGLSVSQLFVGAIVGIVSIVSSWIDIQR